MANSMVWYIYNITNRREHRLITGQQSLVRTVTTNTTQEQRQGINTKLLHKLTMKVKGDKIRSTALIPFMREKNITFTATGMKPFTRVYPFFDKQNITSFVTPSSSGGTGQLVVQCCN